jgi:hypothetical protein
MVAISALAVTGPIPGIFSADTLAESILPIALLNLLVECSDDIEQVRHVVL